MIRFCLVPRRKDGWIMRASTGGCDAGRGARRILRIRMGKAALGIAQLRRRRGATGAAVAAGASAFDNVEHADGDLARAAEFFQCLARNLGIQLANERVVSLRVLDVALPIRVGEPGLVQTLRRQTLLPVV